MLWAFLKGSCDSIVLQDSVEDRVVLGAQGLMMMPAEAVLPGHQGAALVRRLWVHETLRVFQDRLIDDADRDWLLEQVPHHETDHTKPEQLASVSE